MQAEGDHGPAARGAVAREGLRDGIRGQRGDDVIHGAGRPLDHRAGAAGQGEEDTCGEMAYLHRDKDAMQVSGGVNARNSAVREGQFWVQAESGV